MAQASPVGPAPITSTSVCISGRKLALVLGSTSSSSAARNWGMDQDGGTRYDGVESKPETADSSMQGSAFWPSLDVPLVLAIGVSSRRYNLRLLSSLRSN